MRVQGTQTYSISVENPVYNDLNEHVMLSDTLIGLFSNKFDGSIYVNLFSIDKIVKKSTSEPIQSISCDSINQCLFHGTFLDLTETKDTLIWNKNYLTNFDNLDGCLVSQIKLDLDYEKLNFVIDNDKFGAIKSYLRSIASDNMPRLKLIGAKLTKTNHSLYNLLTLSEIFQTKAQVNNLATCTICNKSTAKKNIVHHIAKHILSEQTAKSSSVCGYCGSHTSGCTVTLNKGTGKSSNPESSCPNFFKFNYKSAEKSTLTSPCTNRPVICSLFSFCKKHVWTYNLVWHYRENHPTETMDAVTATLIPTNDEITSIIKTNYYTMLTKLK
jgi:hypothetical protein